MGKEGKIKKTDRHVKNEMEKKTHRWICKREIFKQEKKNL